MEILFPGASLIIDGTQIGLVTDVDGKFSIKVAENDNVRLRNFIYWIKN